MDTVIGTSQTSISVPINFLGLRNMYFTRFVSEPLASSVTSIAANTWTYNFASMNESLAVNFPVSSTNKAIAITCYVWRPGTGKLGNILDGNSAALYNEGTASTKVVQHGTFTGASVASTQANDVIVFEVWFAVTTTNSTLRTCWYYFDGTTENTTALDTVTNHASFLETPQTLTFAGAGPIDMTQAAAKTYANKFITKV